MSLYRSPLALFALLALSAVHSSALPVRRSAVVSGTADCVPTVTVTVSAAVAASTVASAATGTSTASASQIGNFGSCTVPQIKFAVGFDNRKETSFEPVDQVSYNHGSADNIDIITQFMCDALVNTCGADQTAKNTCATAKAAADTVTAKTGGQADAFNAVFGITTNFASVAEVDDQGNVVGGSSAAVTSSAAVDAVSATASATTSVATAAAATATAASSSSIGNFGSCSVPEIQFATGFDGRRETSFEPVDQKSYNHGSADNIDIITQFMCDALVNTCGADQTAKNTCATAKAAADTAAAKTGAQADAFNAVFGIKTNFAAVAEVDDQGNVVSGGSTAAATTNVAVAASSTAAAAATATAAASTGASSSIGNFGSCSVPQIQFATGFDNRKETAFEPVDQTSYNHGSADNIDVITQFICLALTNTCGADQTAKDTCATASAAADAATAKTGAQADAFNAVFGITTNFASVAVVDDTGKVVSSGAASAPAAVSSAAAAATTEAAATASASAPAATTSAAAAAATSGNLQTFTGSLGGSVPPAVTALGNGQFQVAGNSAFNNLQNALTRSCDVQHNACADAANASGNKGALTVAACGTQQTQCDAAVQA